MFAFQWASEVSCTSIFRSTEHLRNGSFSTSPKFFSSHWVIALYEMSLVLLLVGQNTVLYCLAVVMWRRHFIDFFSRWTSLLDGSLPSPSTFSPPRVNTLYETAVLFLSVIKWPRECKDGFVVSVHITMVRRQCYLMNLNFVRNVWILSRVMSPYWCTF